MFTFLSILCFCLVAIEVIGMAKAYQENNIGSLTFNFVFSGINFYLGLKYFLKSIGWL